MDLDTVVSQAHSVVAAAALKLCTGCKTAPTTSVGYATCTRCREKRTEAKRKAVERKRDKFRMQSLANAYVANIKANGLTPPPKESTSAGKRKAPPVDSAGDALERIRKRFKKMDPYIKTDVASKSSSTDSDRVFQKFVVAAELHKYIRRRCTDSSTPFNFHGTYAIIAQPEINNKERAKLVARDLKDNTTLLFDHDKKLSSSIHPGVGYTLTYVCKCSAPKHTGSDISAYFGSKNKVSSHNPPKAECHGTIEIGAEDDKSHPLGWLGQRVKVTITHPKRS
ncbi:hypothetical protein C8F04DRAFT_1262391 [Mycena alexandri]|uniref:Uncharacterized protein n=1 Tax=Mycena alexandri TaxID=1745969 RepID=A0AAD6SQ36_9AGAR|nr:hypothetical protein C8F04DRAFT_1262391 [Mycena alexandri]